MKPRDAKKLNLRDLSYLKKEDGSSLKKGRFYRGGRLVKWPSRVKKELQDNGLSLVIDLRTEGEVQKKPDELWDGLAYELIPLVQAETIGITHEKGLKGYKKPPVMTELYAHIVRDEGSVDALKKIFSTLLDPSREDAVLWHCTAGKDRCGIVSALFLLCLGYNEEDVFADYLLSDEESEKKGRLYRFLIRFLLFKKDLADGVYDAMRAKREYLAAALDAIKQDYGSVAAFLEQRIGIKKEDVDAFWAKNRA